MDKILTTAGSSMPTASTLALRSAAQMVYKRSLVQEIVIRALPGTLSYLLISGGLLAGGAVFYVDAQRAQPSAPAPNAGGAFAPRGVRAAPQSMTRQPTSPPPVAPTPLPPSGAAPAFTSAATVLPSPLQQQASQKPFVEGHWRGMELVELMPELLKEYQLPPSTTGLLVDEVSLEAAESGMLAGDVVKQVGAMGVADLRHFYRATFAVREQHVVQIGLLRAGRPLWVALRSQGPLGFAMFEAASPILPGAVSPHKAMSKPCTGCHIIMATGGQLAIDAGDIPPTPPPIAVGTQATHDNRGPCATCHRIVQPMVATF
jgi:hypothetical protein